MGVGIVDDAGGREGGVSVAMHVFFPIGVTGAAFMLPVGAIFDRYSDNNTSTMVFLAAAGALTCVATNALVYAGTPWAAVIYAFTRGLTSSIYQPLLNGGLGFAAFGVKRNIIGRALGINRLYALAGTGTGPLLYGVAKTYLGTFSRGLQVSSIPP